MPPVNFMEDDWYKTHPCYNSECCPDPKDCVIPREQWKVVPFGTKEDPPVSDKFPYQLSDIIAWVIKRTDGTIVRYNLTSVQDVTSKKKTTTDIVTWPKTSYREFCNHEPHPNHGALPVFTANGISLFIADAWGARKCYQEFDVALDGGNVLSVPGEHDLPNLYGDPGLRGALQRHVYTYTGAGSSDDSVRILKIRWTDRAAPPVYPSFWPALLKELLKLRDKLERGPENPLRVLTICQGGHGRSGSALVLLMMCLTDYSPLDALTHIRALHCARAIESKEQHVYLNSVAALLGRPENALEAEGVSSFKARFLEMDDKVAGPYKERLRSGKGAVVESRDSGYL